MPQSVLRLVSALRGNRGHHSLALRRFSANVGVTDHLACRAFQDALGEQVLLLLSTHKRVGKQQFRAKAEGRNKAGMKQLWRANIAKAGRIATAGRNPKAVGRLVLAR